MTVPLGDILKHHGVKGMKWGVRRNRNRPGGADGKEESEKVVDKRTKLAKNISSMNRERQWKKVVNNVDSLTTPQITAVAKRIGLENDMKRLSKSKMAKPKDKEDYLRRDKMSDAELSRKVTRLRAKENLRKNVEAATKEQRDFGKRVAQAGASVSVKYALTKSVSPKDIFDAYKKPQESANKAKQDVVEKVLSDLQRGRTPR